MRLCIAFALACLTAFAAGTPPKSRLAEVESIQPVSYRAELTLDPEKNTFSGSIVIRMEIGQPTRTIWLNQERIKIESATLSSSGKQFTATAVPGGDDFVGLQFESPVPAGPAAATIRYTGAVIEKNSIAIFRQQEGGNWYLFSQFEATDARGAFPCFDEPSYKTPWQLTLHIPQKDSAISNTPVASEANATDGLKTLVFRETKPLPSYLVAFAVGPFEYVDAGTAGRNKVPVRIVVPKGKAAEAKYAAEITSTLLNRLEDYFGIPYPYEKADQVAIPNTSGWGAMENPGMVTYQQNIILADPKIDRLVRQRRYAEDAAHELAHQWFGDLVTTAWWDDIWLNEAFATWMERKIIAEWKPEWKTRIVDVTDKIRVEGEDALLSVRKIRQPILSKDDINNAFDGITYQKGSAVIGMFEDWMGAEEFRKGVQSYLKQYAWRATTAADFLDSLSSSSKQNVTTAFSTFLNQAGTPLVSLALDCKGPKPALQVRQTRFLPLGSKGTSPQMWNIPLCIRYGSGTNSRSQCTLVTQPSQTVELTSAQSCPAWVQANDRAEGYYTVAYSPELLTALTAGDVEQRLPATERADLMGDVQALSNAGLIPAGQALNLVETFHGDPERYVLQQALNAALGLRRNLVPADLAPNYQRFLEKSFGARARALGWIPKEGESADTLLERPTLVGAIATTGGDRELAAQAQELANKWLADHSVLDPNLSGAVLNTAAYYGDKAFFDRLLAAFHATSDRQTRGTLIGAMAALRDPASIEAGVTALVNGDIPFIQGSRLVVGRGRSADSSRLVFEFIKAHFDQIVAKMPTGGGFDFGSVLPEVGASLCDAASRDELKAFFAPRVSQFAGAPRALDQVIEGIDLCIARRNAQAPSVAAFLAKY